jgi:hypothetical protein
MTVVTVIGKAVALRRLPLLLCEKSAPQKRPAQVLLGALFLAPGSAFSLCGALFAPERFFSALITSPLS